MKPSLPPASKRKPSTLARVVVIGTFGLAVISQGKVMLWDAHDTIDRIQRNPKFFKTEFDYADRGSILSADGQPLATDDHRYLVTMDGEHLPKTPAFFNALGAALDASPAWLIAQAERGRSEFSIELTREQVKAYRSTKKIYRADGILIRPSGKRVYPFGEAFAGVVGTDRGLQARSDPKRPGEYIRDADGKIKSEYVVTGLEATLRDHMSGVNGEVRGMVDQKGRMLPMRSETVRNRKDGDNVVLTIDSEVQRVAYEALVEQCRTFNADKGAAVVVEPETGNIIAMANYPSYDPNKLTGETVDWNPAYRSKLDPGSIFKILTLAKAADNGYRLDATLKCVGHGTFGGKPLKCAMHNGSRAHGTVNAEQALAKSCNIAAARWAHQVGWDAFADYMKSLGLFEAPGVDLYLEASGSATFTDPARGMQLARWGMGQSVTVTPLLMAGAMSMIANEGVRVPLRLVAEKEGKETEIKPGVQVVSKEAADEVLRCMRSVIETEFGTGKHLRIPGYVLAGKTGTAERFDQKRRTYAGAGVNTNFVGFAPGDKPRAAIVVMIENPKTGRFGGTVAGPAFQKIARAVLKKYQVPPDPALVASQSRPPQSGAARAPQ